jgi:hypothetical protein
MDRFLQMGDRVFLLKSRDLYRQAFDAFPSDYYTGINAASKSFLVGEKATALLLAQRVQELLGQQAVPADFWRTATVAELQLVQGRLKAPPGCTERPSSPRPRIEAASNRAVVRQSSYSRRSARTRTRSERSWANSRVRAS